MGEKHLMKIKASGLRNRKDDAFRRCLGTFSLIDSQLIY
jgi:hypothetical protein